MASVTQEYNLHVINPKLSGEWNSTMNGSLTPRDVAPNSHKKVWWICSKGHEWQALISDRNKGSGCPYCSGRKATKEKNLQIINPILAKEWHPKKNGTLTPRDITPNSGLKVWWICSKRHEWLASSDNRRKGKGCPYCSGRNATPENCLQRLNPSLAKEWHPTKNGDLIPTNVTVSSGRKAWWICSKGHEWQALISNRNRGRGCPYCAGQAVCVDNCLQTLNPELAKQWHPTKNKSLTSKNVTLGSNKKVWWVCKQGHEWEVSVKKRNHGRGCPFCSGRRK
jgi:hypothetical protein